MIGLLCATAACAPAAGAADNGSLGTSSDQIALRSTTVLSLAELAYNSGEATATAAIRSGQLTAAQDAQLGAYVHQARACRDEARKLVAAGDDAAGAIESLDAALAGITTLARQ